MSFVMDSPQRNFRPFLGDEIFFAVAIPGAFFSGLPSFGSTLMRLPTWWTGRESRRRLGGAYSIWDSPRALLTPRPQPCFPPNSRARTPPHRLPRWLRLYTL